MADFGPAIEAIRQVCLGTVGSVRSVGASDLVEGAYPSTPEHEAARAVLGPSFEVSILSCSPSKESPWEHSPYRLLDLDVQIRTEWTTAHQLIDSERSTTRSEALAQLEEVRAALMRSGNLTSNLAAEATGLVSGCLHRCAGHRLEREDWPGRRFSYLSRFSTVIRISQTAG